jgi:hypothetical protein
MKDGTNKITIARDKYLCMDTALKESETKKDLPRITRITLKNLV